MAYSSEESFHPDVLRDAIDRDYLLDQLWVPIAQNSFLEKVIIAEQKALQQCDVPIFTTHANSRDLWTCFGDRIPEFLHESGLNETMQRVKELSEDHLERQLWLIQASLATQDVGVRIREYTPRVASGSTASGEKNCCKRRWRLGIG